MIRHLPDAVLLVLIFAIVILLMFVGFIILVVMVYRKKQIVFIKEKLLQEIEYRNQILEKELEAIFCHQVYARVIALIICNWRFACKYFTLTISIFNT